MQPSIQDFIEKARQKGKTDPEIKGLLQQAGWSENQINAALASKDDLVVPPAPTASAVPASQQVDPNGTPLAVTAINAKLTNHGLEYTIMFVALWVLATSVGWLLHAAVQSALSPSAYVSDVTFASAALLVALPMFIGSFIYNRRLQEREAEVAHDRARQALTNLTLLITFLMALGYLIFFLYQLLQGESDGGESIIESFLHMVITVSICATIFIYYWRDSRRKKTS